LAGDARVKDELLGEGARLLGAPFPDEGVALVGRRVGRGEVSRVRRGEDAVEAEDGLVHEPEQRGQLRGFLTFRAERVGSFVLTVMTIPRIPRLIGFPQQEIRS
jgi:hypothetical protein